MRFGKARASEPKGPNAPASTGPVDPGVGYPQPFLPSLAIVPQSRLSLLRRRKSVRRGTMISLGMFVAAGVVLAVLFVTMLASHAAESRAVDRRDSVQAEVSVLMPVDDLYKGFGERQQAVANALASDVDYYSMVVAVQDALQAEIPLEELTQDTAGQWYVKEEWAHIGLVSYSVKATPCPSDEPFQPEPALGCIQGQATSTSYAKAGEAISILNDSDNGLFGGYILSASDQPSSGNVGATSYTFSINFGSGALSQKYADESNAILGSGTPSGATAAASPAPAATQDATTEGK